MLLNAGPALAVQIDQVLGLRVVGARGLLDAREQRGVVDGIHLRVREECHFGFGGTRSARGTSADIAGASGSKRIARQARDRPPRDRGASPAWRVWPRPIDPWGLFAGPSAVFDVQLGHQRLRRLGGVGARNSPARSTPLCMMARWNKPLAPRHREQRADFPAAAGLSEDGDVVRIAAEIGDVVAHPLQRGDDVQHPGIARVGVISRRRSRPGAGTRTNSSRWLMRHRDHVMFARQIRAVIHRVAAVDRW